MYPHFLKRQERARQVNQANTVLVQKKLHKPSIPVVSSRQRTRLLRAMLTYPLSA